MGNKEEMLRLVPNKSTLIKFTHASFFSLEIQHTENSFVIVEYVPDQTFARKRKNHKCTEG